MAPRLYVDDPQAERWHAGAALELPAAAARHVQVLRLQPGHAVDLFNGLGGQWTARITQMTRASVAVELLRHHAMERELGVDITLALGMPANDRMDSLVEKATELGVTTIAPLMTSRSVLRLEGERSLKRRAHWQGVAAAACEQCGRNRVPGVAPVESLSAFLQRCAPAGAEAGAGTGRLARTDADQSLRWMLSLEAADAQPLAQAMQRLRTPTEPGAPRPSIVVLSGPEGGLTPDEQRWAIEAGFEPISLGPRVLRADTAPLTTLAALSVWASAQ